MLYRIEGIFITFKLSLWRDFNSWDSNHAIYTKLRAFLLHLDDDLMRIKIKITKSSKEVWQERKRWRKENTDKMVISNFIILRRNTCISS